MDNSGISLNFWAGKKVLLTGNTGFKGSWMSLLLIRLGAEVRGYSLAPSTNPNLYSACALEKIVIGEEKDIRNLKKFQETLSHYQPEILIHMAAQSLVKESYVDPLTTFEVNIIGTCNVLQASRGCSSLKVILIITSDKVYKVSDSSRRFVELDPIGGADPYSASKAASELATESFYRSYFEKSLPSQFGTSIATARAGNVIGGGDWAPDRLVPDIIRAYSVGQRIKIRNPDSVRPWQFVLEPLRGYLVLIEYLWKKGKEEFSSWNFGPAAQDETSVTDFIKLFSQKLSRPLLFEVEPTSHQPETKFLRLDSSKAQEKLCWVPKYSLDKCLENTASWYDFYFSCPNMISDFTNRQLDLYLSH